MEKGDGILNGKWELDGVNRDACECFAPGSSDSSGMGYLS